jgi:hypothetical protein
MYKTLLLFTTILTLSFPITHIIMKKGMLMDFNLTKEKEKDLTKFFYIPFLNVLISFLYLIWVIIKFKRPD